MSKICKVVRVAEVARGVGVSNQLIIPAVFVDTFHNEGDQEAVMKFKKEVEELLEFAQGRPAFNCKSSIQQ